MMIRERDVYPVSTVSILTCEGTLVLFIVSSVEKACNDGWTETILWKNVLKQHVHLFKVMFKWNYSDWHKVPAENQ